MTYRKSFSLLVAIAALAAGCQKSSSGVSTGSGSATGTGSASGTGSADTTPPKDLDSKDILARPAGTDEVLVKHVLIGWKELAPTYRGHMDKRAQNRTNAAAADLAQGIYDKLKANPDQIDALVKESSEDPGSQSGEPYPVS